MQPCSALRPSPSMPIRWWSWPTTMAAAAGGRSPRWCLKKCEDKQSHWLRPLAGVQRAALHQQPAGSGPAPLGPAVDHRHDGLHPLLPAHERIRRPAAPPAGPAALRLRRWVRRKRWRGNRWRNDATHNRSALAAGHSNVN